MALIHLTKPLFASLKTPVFTGIVLASASLSAALDDNEYPLLDNKEIDWIGEQIFNNECNRNPSCLTSWNEGENFPSLGIGHFIWYQEAQEEIFEESFPLLLQSLKDKGLSLPAWIEENSFESPWQSRSEFQSDFNSDRMSALRDFLARHTREQTEFIIDRFNGALEQMLASETSENASQSNEMQVKSRIQENFFAVANAEPPYGLYALIDYVNFKGTGTSPLERYQNKGWGLKQVLLEMDNSQAPLPAFIQSARDALNTRVQNAPPDRNESRWLAGWNNRLNTYMPTTLP